MPQPDVGTRDWAGLATGLAGRDRVGGAGVARESRRALVTQAAILAGLAMAADLDLLVGAHSAAHAQPRRRRDRRRRRGSRPMADCPHARQDRPRRRFLRGRRTRSGFAGAGHFRAVRRDGVLAVQPRACRHARRLVPANLPALVSARLRRAQPDGRTLGNRDPRASHRGRLVDPASSSRRTAASVTAAAVLS